MDWWLDENAHAGREHLDPAYVAAYDRKAGFDPSEDIEALKRHGLMPGSVVIDLGAGTGTFALAAARYCGQVTAVDVSPAMASVLRRRVTEAKLDNVSVVEAGFLSFELPGPPVDFVFSRNALHQLPDFWKGIALVRIHRLLAPGGVLRLRDLVYDFEPATAARDVERWVRGVSITDPERGFTSDDLAEHVRTENSTYSFLFDALLERVGFETLEREVHRQAYATYTCRRP
jgi:ubiquinone/menaquinone biosynthesis C-methylase UbiE